MICLFTKAAESSGDQVSVPFAKGIDHWAYNGRRSCLSLNRETPDQAYFNKLPQTTPAGVQQEFYLQTRKLLFKEKKPS